MVILDSHHPHGAPDAHQGLGQLETEPEVLKLRALDPHVLLDHVTPEPELDDVGLHVVLQHVVLGVHDGRDVKQDGISGAIQFC